MDSFVYTSSSPYVLSARRIMYLNFTRNGAPPREYIHAGCTHGKSSPELRLLATNLRGTSSHLEFLMDNVALGRDFLEYFGFHCQFAFH
jgi:hypothetical protein